MVNLWNRNISIAHSWQRRRKQIRTLSHTNTNGPPLLPPIASLAGGVIDNQPLAAENHQNVLLYSSSCLVPFLTIFSTATQIRAQQTPPSPSTQLPTES